MKKLALEISYMGNIIRMLRNLKMYILWKSKHVFFLNRQNQEKQVLAKPNYESENKEYFTSKILMKFFITIT